MKSVYDVEIVDENAMGDFGAAVARVVSAPMVIELIGDIGAGKTSFTRALARALGVKGPIQSPTFTISNRYELDDGRVIAHYDFYRLTEPGIMRAEIDESIHDPMTLTVIEWGNIVADILPKDRLSITLKSPTETSRQIEVVGHGDASTMVERLQNVYSA